MWQRGNYNTIHQELFLETCDNITEVHTIADKQKKSEIHAWLSVKHGLKSLTGDQVKMESSLGQKDLCQRVCN